MKKRRLSPEQAYAAMLVFLERHRARTGDGELSALLGDLQPNGRDGLPFDPAASADWMEAVEAVLGQSEELAAARR